MTEAAKPEKKPTIYEAIPLIIGAIPPIAKTHRNEAQKYSFRGIEDVYKVLNLLLAQYSISILPEVLESSHAEAGQTKSGSAMWRHHVRVRYHFRAADGSTVFADSEGEGMDTGDKSTPKAFSTAFKTMAFQVFCIPTGEKIDSEEDSPEVEAKPAPKATGAPPSNGNGHAPAASKAPPAHGENAATEAKAFAATIEAINAAASAGDLAVISERLPKISVTDGQRRIISARLKSRLESFQ